MPLQFTSIYLYFVNFLKSVELYSITSQVAKTDENLNFDLPADLIFVHCDSVTPQTGPTK